ncbi:zinc carboxypeptidase [Moniliophthora roreri MCA 2997]|uniref:Inactive metallocarboxypeptidase ECM14 n=1 Tax=Moniliophthora roreri (strain MCA 2997) TaxID=1381753 RepID=V2WZF7_MONRO|nr:zinc carboxypeptidase [Moniliophthora roreri MCA 2997]KAI3607620.1 zinc carboxypeptidase [Moniliophthora roreri]
MASKCISITLWVALWSLATSASPFWHQQQPILSTGSTATGTLRRFNFSSPHDLNSILGIAHSHDLDIWQVSSSHIDIYAKEIPSSLSSYPHTFSQIPLSTPHVSSDEPWNLSSLVNTTYHASYHPLYEIDQFIHDLAELYPGVVSVLHLGHSAQGREMLGLKIAKLNNEEKKHDGEKPGPKPPKRDKPGKERELDPAKKLGFVLVGAQHAREWVATATSLYLAHALVSNETEAYSLNPLLDLYDFYVIPAPNPDGYTYTWETDRFWYKNRQIMGPRAKCIGLDMNRNWGYKWKPYSVGDGSLTTPDAFKKKGKTPKEPEDPCSHWYPGHRPFESPEVNNIANYMTTLPNLVAFLDLRAYGQMLSSPYSFSCNRIPADAEDQMEAALGATASLRNVHGTEFVAGRLCELLYRAPGNMIDWMYKRVGIKYSYAAHLRDTGTYGFSLPAQWIRPVGEETASMVRYLAKFIAVQMRR